MKRLFVSISLLFFSTEAVSAQGTSSEREDVDKKARAAGFLKTAQRAAAGYQFYANDDLKSKLKLHQQPILRWTNPVIGEVYGGVFVWTANGRPEVIVSIYRFYSPYQVIGHEFQSLSLGKPIAIRDDRRVWLPARAGLELKSVPESPTPADSPSKRLLQMRKLAGQFSAVKRDYQQIDRKLRLLNRPLYRYQSGDPNLLDGAMFAFVHGTDPEVVLLIEARRTKQGFVWQYAIARLHHRRLRVFHKDKQVWEIAEILKPQIFDSREPYWKNHFELAKGAK